MRDGGASWQGKQDPRLANFSEFFIDRKMNELYVIPNFPDGLSREQVRHARNVARLQGRNSNTFEHAKDHTAPSEEEDVTHALLEALREGNQMVKAGAQLGVPAETLVVPPASAGSAEPSVPGVGASLCLCSRCFCFCS